MGDTVNADPALDWARTAYGLELREGVLRCARAWRVGGTVRCEPVPDWEAAARAAADPTAVTVLGLGARACIVRRLRIPLAAREKALRVLPSLLDVELPFPIEDCAAAFPEVVRVGEDAHEALAVAARRTDAAAALDAARARGWEPEGLDVEALALWRAARRCFPLAPGGGDRARILLFVAEDRTVVLLGRGGTLLGVHSFRDDAFRHMDRLLRAEFKGVPDAIDWILAGAGAEGEGRQAALRARIGPGGADAVLAPERPTWFLVESLAMGALTSEPLVCNLRPALGEHPKVAARNRRQAGRTAAAAAAVGALLLGIGQIWSASMERRVVALEQRFQATANEIAGQVVTPRGAHAVARVRQAREARRTQYARVRRFLDPSLLHEVGELLAVAQGRGALHALRLSTESFEARGRAVDGNRAVEIQDLLAARGYTTHLERPGRTDGPWHWSAQRKP